MRIETAEFVRSVFKPQDFLQDGRVEVAFAGRSNVGKSSVLNRLLGRKALARTSSTPGRTRSVNYYLINDRFYFVDLPGYGYARVSRQERRTWAGVVDAYFRQTLPRAQVVLLVDGKVGATDLDRQAFEYLLERGARVLVVATKTDRIRRSKRPASLGRIREALPLSEDARLIPFSARTGEGVKELWRELSI